MKKKSVSFLLLAVFSYTSLYTGALEAGRPSHSHTLELASFSTISLPDKSKAVLKKLFPNIQLEVGEVPAPYHHAGREKVFG